MTFASVTWLSVVRLEVVGFLVVADEQRAAVGAGIGRVLRVGESTVSGVGVGAAVGVACVGVVVGLGLAAEPQAANTIAETATSAMIGLRINAPPMWRSRIA